MAAPRFGDEMQPPGARWVMPPPRSRGPHESMGPPRDLPRHRSVSRLTDGWRSSGGSPGPVSAFGSPGPMSAAYTWQQQRPPQGGHPYPQALFHTPARYTTPALTVGPSATPGSWASASARAAIPPNAYHPHMPPRSYEQYHALPATPSMYRSDSVDIYGDYAKQYAQRAPRSSSIGPWLQAAHASASRGRSSSSTRSTSRVPMPAFSPAPLMHPRTYEHFTPAYGRPTSSVVPSGRVPVEVYAHGTPFGPSRAYSERPGMSHLGGHAFHTPTPSHIPSARNAGSAPGSFPRPSNRALSYVLQATSSATAGGSPVVRARDRHPLQRTVEATESTEPKPEPSPTPAPGALFDTDRGGEEEVAETQPSSPNQAHRPRSRQGHKEAPVASTHAASSAPENVIEVLDFDDEADEEDIGAATAVKSPTKRPAPVTDTSVKSPPKQPAPLPASAVQSPHKRPAPVSATEKRSKRAKVAVAATASSSPSISVHDKPIRQLSDWFLFTHKTKKLPKEVANRLRFSPFSRVLGTDDFSKARLWIRAAGQISREEVARMGHVGEVDDSDCLWETSLVTGARRASSESSGIQDGTIIISTSTGAEYALVGPMNVDKATQQSDLKPSFWREFDDTGGLGEDGWEALILRAILGLSASAPSGPTRNEADCKTQPKARQADEAVPSWPPNKTQIVEVVIPSRPDPVVAVGSVDASVAKKTPVKARRRSDRVAVKHKTKKTSSSSPPKSAKSALRQGGKELANLSSSPFGSLIAVRQALEELGMAVEGSDDEDELSMLFEDEPSSPVQRKTQQPSHTPVVRLQLKGPRRSLQEIRLPGELSDVSDSADEYREDSQVRAAGDDGSMSDDSERSTRRQGAASRRLEGEDNGSSRSRSARLRSKGGSRMWWQVSSPQRPKSKSKATVRSGASANRSVATRGRRTA